jgi:hypothetical protein
MPVGLRWAERQPLDVSGAERRGAKEARGHRGVGERVVDRDQGAVGTEDLQCAQARRDARVAGGRDSDLFQHGLGHAPLAAAHRPGSLVGSGQGKGEIFAHVPDDDPQTRVAVERGGDDEAENVPAALGVPGRGHAVVAFPRQFDRPCRRQRLQLVADHGEDLDIDGGQRGPREGEALAPLVVDDARLEGMAVVAENDGVFGADQIVARTVHCDAQPSEACGCLGPEGGGMLAGPVPSAPASVACACRPHRHDRAAGTS